MALTLSAPSRYAPAGKAMLPGLTSVVILTFNGWTDTECCLETLVGYTPEPRKLIVVNNDCTPERAAASVAAQGNIHTAEPSRITEDEYHRSAA